MKTMLVDLFKERIDDIVRLLQEYTRGNFDNRLKSTEDEGELNAVINGINQLGKELKTVTTSRNFLSGIYNAIIDPLFVLDHDYTIQSINQAVTELWGYGERDIAGHSFFSLLNNKANDTFTTANIIRTTLDEKNAIRSMELHLRDKKGNGIVTLCSLSMLRDDTKQKRKILVIAKDLDHQKNVSTGSASTNAAVNNENRSTESLPQQQEPPVDSDSKSLTFERKLNVLVVDDNDINMMVAVKLLTSLGATVSRASNGKIAVDKIRNENFDVVLMDIQMPVLDGYAATAAVREMGSAVPIIALSANIYSEHVRQSYDSGMNGHLQKPFTKKQLFDTINHCLGVTQSK